MMNTLDAKRVLETALLCASQPLQVRELRQLFHDELATDTLKTLLESLQQDWQQRGLELVQVASGCAWQWWIWRGNLANTPTLPCNV